RVVAVPGLQDLEAGLLQVTRLDIALRILIVDIQYGDLGGHVHGRARMLTASRRNRDTFSREIRFFEISRVPTGNRAFSSAFTASDVETTTGMMLVRSSALSSCSTVKPSMFGICRSRTMTSGRSSLAWRSPSLPLLASSTS